MPGGIRATVRWALGKEPDRCPRGVAPRRARLARGGFRGGTGSNCRQATRSCHGSLTRTTTPVASCGDSGGKDTEVSAPSTRDLRAEGTHAAEEDGESTALVVNDNSRRSYAEFDRDKLQDELDAGMEEAEQAARNAGEDEEEAAKKFCRDAIMAAETSKDLLERAEWLIKEEWLNRIEALPGNIFAMGAFGEFTGSYSNYLKLVGFALIVGIQTIAPPLILLSKAVNWGTFTGDGKDYLWECWSLIVRVGLEAPSDTGVCWERAGAESSGEGFAPGQLPGLLYDWTHISSTKCLGFLFTMAFCLNGWFVLMEEAKTWKDLYNTFRYIEIATPKFHFRGEWCFVLGAMVNIWVVVWCSICTYVVVGSSRSPQDLLLDALGMLFLYNLDDIGGDLGFVDDDDWDGERIAWIYEECVKNVDDEIFDEDQLDGQGQVILGMFRFAKWFVFTLCFALPGLATITPFMVIAPSN